MASAGRNPKDLRQMVAASQNAMDDMQGNLAKLKALSHDDKSENAMLRSRIDEQSQLIMILKTQTDDSTTKMRTLQKINAELEHFRDEANEKLKMEIKKYNMVEARFNDLAANHEEMIKYKDEYKRQNEFLRKENARILGDNEQLFSKAINERDEIITEMDKKLIDLKGQCANLERKNKTLESQLQISEEMYRKDIKELKSHSNDLEEKLKVNIMPADGPATEGAGASADMMLTQIGPVVDDISSSGPQRALSRLQHQSQSAQNISMESQQQIAKLTKQKDEMLDLAMQRGKLIQEKGTENKKLQQKIEEMERAVREMEAKFERESAAVNANRAVQKLRKEVEEADAQCDQVIKDFEAFKKHSAGMLKKEQELNARLRHLVG